MNDPTTAAELRAMADHLRAQADDLDERARELARREFAASLRHFTRQADSTHCVIYGTPNGELLVSYWPRIEDARAELVHIGNLAARIRREENPHYDPNARIESLAEIDSAELNIDPEAVA